MGKHSRQTCCLCVCLVSMRRFLSSKVQTVHASLHNSGPIESPSLNPSVPYIAVGPSTGSHWCREPLAMLCLNSLLLQKVQKCPEMVGNVQRVGRMQQSFGRLEPGWGSLHPLCQRLASLGIMGANLRAPFKVWGLGIMTEGFQGMSWIGNIWLLRHASLSDSYASV